MNTVNRTGPDYAEQVDLAFMALSGLSYSFVRSEIERSPAAIPLAEAVRHDMSPAEFAVRVSNRFGFKDRTHSDAVPHNRRLAALVEFAAENADWTIGLDGAVYREGPMGLERLAPAADVEGRRFGFAASVSGDGVMEVSEGRMVALSGEFEPLVGALDIGDAVERLEARYDRGFSM